MSFFCFKFRISKPATDNSQVVSSTVGPQDTSVTDIHATLLDISASGKPYQCNTSYSDEDGSGNGSLYSPGDGTGKLTLEVISEPNKNSESTTLLLGEKIYNWSTSGKNVTGYVFDKSMVKPKTGGTLIANTSSIPAKDFAFKCKDWTVDRSVLEIPKSVNFANLPVTQ